MFICGPRISRATAAVQSRSSIAGSAARAIRGIGLGAEVLDNDFLDVAVTPVELSDRQQRADPFGLRLADADEDAGGEGDGEFARRLDHGEPRGGMLVGRAIVRPPFSHSRGEINSSIRPCDTLTSRIADISAGLVIRR